ncbi:MAG: hypothetical protein OEW26_03940 [Nitrospirota bacterium]|nr:hypothetical protein [Nitrospirota bacterium]
MNFFKLSCRKGVSFIVMGLLTFPLTFTSSVHAGAQEEAQRYCTQYETSTARQCHVEKCPCGVGEKSLKKFDRKGLKRAIACVSPNR